MVRRWAGAAHAKIAKTPCIFHHLFKRVFGETVLVFVFIHLFVFFLPFYRFCFWPTLWMECKMIWVVVMGAAADASRVYLFPFFRERFRCKLSLVYSMDCTSIGSIALPLPLSFFVVWGMAPSEIFATGSNVASRWSAARIVAFKRKSGIFRFHPICDMPQVRWIGTASIWTIKCRTKHGHLQSYQYYSERAPTIRCHSPEVWAIWVNRKFGNVVSVRKVSAILIPRDRTVICIRLRRQREIWFIGSIWLSISANAMLMHILQSIFRYQIHRLNASVCLGGHTCRSHFAIVC